MSTSKNQTLPEILDSSPRSKVSSIDRLATDEKTQKALTAIERFTLVSDGDGHRFVIPIFLKPEFDRWSEVFDSEGDEMYDEDPDKFEEYRLDGGMLTFTDPRVN